MRYLKLAVLLLTVVMNPIEAGAEYNPLLPRPQKIRYGTGRLAVRAVSIRFGSPPTLEDRFAAGELSRALKEITGIDVPIWESQGQSPAIMLTRTAGLDPLPMPDEQPGPESREGYHLKVTPTGAEIQGRSSAAVFYGVQTLRQLVEGKGDAAFLPEVEIDDWPSLAYRGTMVDVGSEGAMSTEEDIKRQIDFLARWKANQYYFYNETSIELAGYPLLNPDARFTKDQVRRIVAYGRERHIDVIPCLELYGHLHNFFRVEQYSDLADFPYGGEFNPSNPEGSALLSDWVDQFVELFPSAFVHIGFDETYQIEEAAKKQGAGATPAKLFVEQLNNVTHLFEQRGKRVMAWGDIMVKYPGIISQLPPSLVAVAWAYDAAPDPEYKRWLGPLVAKGVPHIVAPGVQGWVEIVPDFHGAFENIDTFLAAGRKSKALGLMNTVWNDSEQNLIREAWPSIAYGAIAPWQSAPVDRARFFSDYARQMYPSEVAPEVAQALDNLAQAETTLQRFVGDRDTVESMWNDPFTPALLKSGRQHREDLHQTRLLAEEAEEHLYRVLSSGGDPSSLDSLLLGCRMLDYTGMRYLYTVEIADKWEHEQQQNIGEMLYSGITVDDLIDTITELRPVYEANWLREYTPYRLRKALARWDAECEYWRRIQVRFDTFVRGYKEGEPLPPLDSIVTTVGR
jgi:hypothetical protein